MLLDELFKPISADLKIVKQQLKQQLNTLYAADQLRSYEKSHVSDVMNHFFSAPGKGVRPALMLLATKLVESEEMPTSSPAVIQFATAVEFFHSASLAHDDVLDHAKYRRNQLSLNEKFGNHIAVVVGDVLLLQGFTLIFSLEIADLKKKDKIFQIIRRALQKMCLGELCAHRLLTEKDTADVNEYVGLLDKKTATLMSACCECSAVLTKDDPEISRRMADFGTHFGIAFQVADDLKDQDALVKKGVDLTTIAETYVQKAKDDLSTFPDNTAKQSLLGLCDKLLPDFQSPGMFDTAP